MIIFKKGLNLKNLTNFFENQSFYISGLFLSWALPFAILLLLISIITSLSSNLNKIRREKLFFIFSLLVVIMFFSSLINYLNFDLEKINSYWNNTIVGNTNKSNIWLHLLNWFPMFLIFFSSQKYLNQSKKRIKFAIYLIIGTIPVLISCILQYFFKIYGPFNFLFGTIVWFQKEPPLYGDFGIAGLFSNQNYTGCWLASIFPFSIYLLLKEKSNFLKKLTFFANSLLTSFFIILTNSRNAFIGLIISLFIIFKFKGLATSLLIGFIFSLILILIYFQNNFIFNEIINKFTNNPILKKIYNFAMQIIYWDNNLFSFPRLEIINMSFILISEKPFWGHGAGTFQAIYGLAGGQYNAQHTHNLPIQLAYDYGIPTAVIIFFIIAYLFINSTYKVFFLSEKNNLIDKCWLLSAAVLIMFNITDITIYDGKLNILFWILIAGLNSIINENNTAEKIN